MRKRSGKSGQMWSVYPAFATDVQQRIIGSMFPEKILFSKNNYRTHKVNQVAELIRSINKPSGRNKKGQFCEKTELSYQVAGIGLEPMTFGL